MVRGLLSKLEDLGSELQSPIKEGREGRRGEWCGEFPEGDFVGETR